MAQFDIHARPDRRPDDPIPWLLDLQAELLDRLQTRLVAPLVPLRTVPLPIRVLNPRIDVRGEPHLLLVQQCAAVPRGALGEVVGTAAAHRREILAALDLLVTGS